MGDSFLSEVTHACRRKSLDIMHPIHNSYLHSQQIIARTGDSNEIRDRFPARLVVNWLSSSGVQINNPLKFSDSADRGELWIG